MHAGLGREYPDLMDEWCDLLPADRDQRRNGQPAAAAEAIRPDPEWNNGNYEKKRAMNLGPCRQLVCAPKAPRAFRNWRRPALQRQALPRAARSGPQGRMPTTNVGDRGDHGL